MFAAGQSGAETAPGEVKQMGVFSKWRQKDSRPDRSDAYPPELYKPVLHCSICTGEKVAGFREKETGKFIDIMLIRDDSDLECFRQQYGVKELEKEY